MLPPLYASNEEDNGDKLTFCLCLFLNFTFKEQGYELLTSVGSIHPQQGEWYGRISRCLLSCDPISTGV